MKKVILLSNYRLQVALITVRVLGRSPETMAEVRDALNQRRNMRRQARFAGWCIEREYALRQRFDCMVARCHLQTLAGEQAAFRQFCLAEYQRN